MNSWEARRGNPAACLAWVRDVKARWDPRDEFRHALAIRPPK
ncbi:hypothetical protein [Streptomyces syringium]